MTTAKKIYQSDDQGVVHVDVPVGRPGQRVAVLVEWEMVGEQDDLDPEASSMAELVGLLQEGDLTRPPHAAYEKRDPLG